MKKFPIALQLYSVRGDMEADFTGTLKKVKALGYDGVEFAGLFGRSAQEVRAQLDEIGLRGISAHVPYAEMMTDPEKVLGDYAAIGCAYIAIPYAEEAYRPGGEKFEEMVENAKMLGRIAKEKGLPVSFDGNFRSTLWTWDEARDFCTECLPYVDVLLGIEPYHLWKDENDHSKGDWKDGVPLQPSYEQQDEIFQHFIERYPNLKCIARHVRYAHSGSENSLKAFMWYDGHTFESKLFTFNILDRVGGGDAFASGLIYAMLHNYRAMDMINFAVASSAIKHTIHGDANITDDVSTIRNLMNMNYDIKR